MDYYLFQSSVSLLDIQMLYDLLSYNKTISFLTINQDEIDKILGCMSLRKLSISDEHFVCVSMRLFSWDGKEKCEWINEKKKKDEEKEEKKCNKISLFSSFMDNKKNHANNEQF